MKVNEMTIPKFATLARHIELLAAGYTYEHVPATIEDIGGPDTGPIITYEAAFDCYQNDDHVIYFTPDGLETSEQLVDVDAMFDEICNAATNIKV